MKPFVYWTVFNQDHWNFYIAATEKGLCFVGCPEGSFDELSSWVSKRLKGFVLLNDEKKMKPYMDELKKYFKKETKECNVPVDLYGTPFQKEVWAALQTIPHGSTLTYSELANKVNKPTAVRAVGTAIGANPVMIAVPCHRVIGKNGSLTGFRGGLEMKKRLLALEKGNEQTQETAK